MADRTVVIAEAGVNHDGDIDAALRLVDVAADAGADIVKFQTFKADRLVTAGAARADYQVANLRESGTQRDMLRRLELTVDDHRALVVRCRERAIRFMSTAFDAESLAFLATLDMPAIKIPSGDITCAPLLLQAARLRRPLIVSTGMSTLADVEIALGVIAFGLTTDGEPRGRVDFSAALASVEGLAAVRSTVTLLHCVTEYPAPIEAVNLRAMDTMASAFGVPVGYSDHTTGIAIAIAAVARGAVIIEKHFTLDRNRPGPDHAASLEPAELAAMVATIRSVERALGSATKEPAPAEMKNLPVARRSIVAAQSIGRGETLTASMLACKRPGHGVSPIDFWDLVGERAHRDYAPDDVIER